MIASVDRCVQIQGAVGGVGNHANLTDVRGLDPFQPHRPPDAGGAGVAAAVGFIARGLLAVGLETGALVVVSADDERVFAGHERVRDFKGEGNVAALVYADGLAVYPRFAAEVDRTEVQKHALALRLFRQRERAAIPHGGHKVLVLDAGKPAFRAEGNGDFAAVRAVDQAAGTSARAMIDFKLPGAVQVHPAGTNKLRAGIFRAGKLTHRALSF